MISFWKDRKWSWLLWPPSKIYRLIMLMRQNAYGPNKLNIKKLDAAVISVGNITVGGTGKTPTVIALAACMQQQGHRVGIISRGYGRQSNESVIVVSDGEKILSNAEESGDEPLLMAERLPGVPVIVCADRTKAGQLGIDMFGLTHIIADDAMQHIRLYRDADLVVMDATQPWGNGWMIPAGPLREPLTQLKKACAILLTRTDQAGDISALTMQLQQWTSAPVYSSSHRPVAWIDENGNTLPISKLSGKKAWAFTGIGNPDAFHHSLSECSIKVEGMTKFKDHHYFDKSDLNTIELAAADAGVEYIVTTEKDMVKLSTQYSWSIPVMALRIDIFIQDGMLSLSKRLNSSSPGQAIS
ncbi:tetraacyldisaccharide 4'-kinase [bacterium]|nr:tetraacyldisaccharide 4'-kinase [bacterium]